MATSAGRILLIPKGNYDAATTYQPLDIVFYNSASYVCKATTLGNAPTNTTYWQIFSEGFDVEQFYANIAPTYNAATTYAAGDHFIYNDVIYTVNVACTGITPPNSNYYSVATITGLIEDNTAAISTLNSNLTDLITIDSSALVQNPFTHSRNELRKLGKMCQFYFNNSLVSELTSGSTFATIPSDYAPHAQITFPVWKASDSSVVGFIYISANSTSVMYSGSTISAGTWIAGGCAWISAN